MTTTVTTTPTTDDGAPIPGAGPAGTRTGRARWPIFGAAGAVTGLVAVMVSMSNLAEDDYNSGVAVLAQLERGGYHAGFLLGLVSVACLLVAASGWKRWADRHVPDSLAGRTLSQGLATTATINVIFFCLMGSMALYLPGGTDAGWLSKESMLTNFTLLDFGALLGWWGAAVSAICVAVLAFGRDRALPRWMGIVSVVLLIPPFAMAIGMALPGFVGLTMPIWLVVISVGMVFSRKAGA